MCVKLRHAIFQRSTPRGTFSNWGLNEGVEGREMRIFQRKTGHILETVRDIAKVTIDHQ